MNLFLNAVSQKGKIILFDNNRHIVDIFNINILGNESSKLSNLLDNFLIEKKIAYNDLNNIVVVAGPGSFTGIRVISLMINTIVFVYNKINITEINFFDLFDNYPIIKSSSKRDLFVKYNKLSTIEIVKNEDFLKTNKNKKVYGDVNNDFLLKEIDLIHEINYNKIIKNIKFDNKKIVNPLYIKKPSIS